MKDEIMVTLIATGFEGKDSKLKEAILEHKILSKIKAVLDENGNPRLIDFDDEEMKVVKNFNLLSMKPMIYIANVAEEDLHDPSSNEHYQNLIKLANEEGLEVILISAQVEMEIASLEPDEQVTFLEAYGLKKSGLNEVIEKSYYLLGLKTYFTAGVKEVRAWTIRIGDTAPKAAGEIHTDFEKGFIRAKVVAFDKFIENNGWKGSQEAGDLRLEGKEYIVQDGDLMEFLFNV
jgi:GTP-binding protein YchF